MYILKTEASFDAAHFLADYSGKCKNIHGHRWRVCIEVEGEKLCEDRQSRGMLVDFGALKKDVKTLADHFDHAFIIEKGTLKQKTMEALLEEEFRIIEIAFRPTAENFAKYFYDEIKKLGYEVACATIYETPTNCASYKERQASL